MPKPSPWSIAAVLVVAALGLGGCGGAQRPDARIATSQGAIRGAEEAGAQSVPQAALHLKLAEEEREHALELVKSGENHRAELLLARAEADAELALALARQAAAAAEAEKADEELQAISRQAKE
ncbi:MAG TPA: hypothetical protein VFK02_24845 [Kofleriaceae bacterium]|nr:hypothetical protein [Kofleriaceae bacterium]